MKSKVSKYSDDDFKAFTSYIGSLKSMKATSSTNTASNDHTKWIDPSQKNCTQNGGKLVKDGRCEAKWKDAGNICSSLGAKLPTIEQLWAVVENCGGVIKDLKNKGFLASGRYWSSSLDVDTNIAFFINFFSGHEYLWQFSSKEKPEYVRCVKDAN